MLFVFIFVFLVYGTNVIVPSMSVLLSFTFVCFFMSTSVFAVNASVWMLDVLVTSGVAHTGTDVLCFEWLLRVLVEVSKVSVVIPTAGVVVVGEEILVPLPAEQGHRGVMSAKITTIH